MILSAYQQAQLQNVRAFLTQAEQALNVMLDDESLSRPDRSELESIRYDIKAVYDRSAV